MNDDNGKRCVRPFLSDSGGWRSWKEGSLEWEGEVKLSC